MCLFASLDAGVSSNAGIGAARGTALGKAPGTIVRAKGVHLACNVSRLARLATFRVERDLDGGFDRIMKDRIMFPANPFGRRAAAHASMLPKGERPEVEVFMILSDPPGFYAQQTPQNEW